MADGCRENQTLLLAQMPLYAGGSVLPVVYQLGYAGIYRLALPCCQRQRIEHRVVNLSALQR